PTIEPDKEFQPQPVRPLERDKDGVVLASGRRPGQLAEPITGTDDFYIVSKNAAGDPFIQLADWRLRVDGEVQRSIEVDYRSLRNLPPVEVNKTLECISNFVTKCELAPFGCDLISTAQWKGARLSDVLTLAGGLKPGVSSLMAIAADDFTTALPIEVAMDPETLLVYEMNGRPLPREHGYPARILVPGRYGMKNAKWVVALRPLGQEFDDWYGQRNWSKHGIVKTMTRIDTPARDAVLPPGKHRIAGIAYAGDRGIRKVEFSADGGDEWRVAELIERPAGRDVWVRWEGAFTLPAGESLTLMARATDGTGELQIEPFSLPQPDGSSGWHSLEVRAQSA
ncbi:MAG: molybdopterin-dependent oxidoreductase, partial [Chloroflexota bacterium]|nr:molybdopterin-dependent oxidoreductase [Chloroflexota bacterium]